MIKKDAVLHAVPATAIAGKFPKEGLHIQGNFCVLGIMKYQVLVWDGRDVVGM
jgi:hypothetical protein